MVNQWEFERHIKEDIQSLSESLLDKMNYLECLKKGLVVYEMKRDWNKIDSYQRTISNIRFEIGVLENLLCERHSELQHFLKNNQKAA